MAKIRTPDTEAETAAPAAPAETVQTPAPEPVKSGKPAKPAPQAPAALPPFVLQVLKKFPRYKALYVDASGGTYTPDTAPAIRGRAVLYENPFYKQ